MNVVFMSSNLNGITFQIFTDSTDILDKIVFDLLVNQIFSVLCTEYDMSIDFGKRLWHNKFSSGLRLAGWRAFICGRCFWHSALHYVIDFAPLGQLRS